MVVLMMNDIVKIISIHFGWLVGWLVGNGWLVMVGW